MKTLPRAHSALGNGKTGGGLDIDGVVISNIPDCTDCLREELKAFTHTRGPWFAIEVKESHSMCATVWLSEDSKDYNRETINQIATVNGQSLEAMNANARLIAAAPSLLRDLKRALSIMDAEPECNIYKSHKEMFQTTINKAEGN